MSTRSPLCDEASGAESLIQLCTLGRKATLASVPPRAAAAETGEGVSERALLSIGMRDSGIIRARAAATTVAEAIGAPLRIRPDLAAEMGGHAGTGIGVGAAEELADA
jgi:hypothetical protein